MAPKVSLFHEVDWNEKWSLEDFSLPNQLWQLFPSSDSPPGIQKWKYLWDAIQERQHKAQSFIYYVFLYHVMTGGGMSDNKTKKVSHRQMEEECWKIEGEKSLKGKKEEGRKRSCALVSQAERTGPLNTTLEEPRRKKRQDWPGNKEEQVRDDRRRGGTDEDFSLVASQILRNSWRSEDWNKKKANKFNLKCLRAACYNVTAHYYMKGF